MEPYRHTVAIVANSLLGGGVQLQDRIRSHAMVVAVDGGLAHCHRLGIRPDIIVGDLDSINHDILHKYHDVPVRRFPTEKNESDTELAIEAVYTPDVEMITLFAASGGRADHFLSNLHLIRHYPRKVYMENEHEVLFAFDGEIEIPCTPGQVISFIHLGNPINGINTQGLKWELQEATFDKYFFSLSNICLGKVVKASVREGDLICCMQKAN